MKKMKLLKLIIIIGFTCSIICANESDSSLYEDFRNSINGLWEYQYSIVDGDTINKLTYKPYPPGMMKFESCNDSTELLAFNNVYISKMRAENAFKNIRCIHYNEAKAVIDTAYPVIRFNGNKTVGDVTNYGKKIKFEYSISGYTNSTLILSSIHYYIKSENTFKSDSLQCPHTK